MALEYEEKEGGPSDAAELLAKMTGRPEEDFRPDEYEVLDFDELTLRPKEKAED